MIVIVISVWLVTHSKNNRKDIKVATIITITIATASITAAAVATTTITAT